MFWLKSYLSIRKQYIEHRDDFNKQKATNLLQLKCEVKQGSILGSLHFLIYINDLSLVSKYLSSIMLADDTNLFYSHKSIKILLKNANDEKVNKFSLNEGKIKITLFHKPRDNDNLPLQLPNLIIDITK